MPTKEEVIERLHKPNYGQAEVIHLVNSVIIPELKAPSTLKKGDVFIQYVGVKRRPVVVVKVLNEIVLGIPLSTTEDCLNLTDSNSRFFGKGFFSNQAVTAPVNYVLENFAGVYDNQKALNEAIKKLRYFINQNL